jgi:hypothetical protein
MAHCTSCDEFMFDEGLCPECELYEEMRELQDKLAAGWLGDTAEEIADSKGSINKRIDEILTRLDSLKELAEEDEIIARRHP